MELKSTVMEESETVWNRFMESARLYLREVRLSDVDDAYSAWMNDPEVTRYTESRFRPHSRETLQQYVTKMVQDPDQVFLAIVTKKGDRHIGNIKIGPINWIHRSSEVGLIIGDKSFWGKGYGSEAIRAASDLAFRRLNLRKLTAGCYAPNLASIKAFKKAGYREEGVRRSQYFLEGRYVDAVLLGLLREDWARGSL